MASAAETPTASAVSSISRDLVAVPSSGSAVKIGAAGVAETDASSGGINCDVSTDYPHQSTTDPSTWNVHGVVECNGDGNGNVPRLDLSVRISRDGEWTVPSAVYNEGWNNLGANSAATCDLEGYQTMWAGEATAVVTMPSGYDPATLNLEYTSTTIMQGTGRCGVAPAVVTQ